MEHIACPLCSSPKQRILFDRLDHTHYTSQVRFKVVKCTECSMVFVNPRPGPSEIAAYYPADFYEVDTKPQDLLRQKQFGLEARARFLQHIKPGRLLDIGCQKGEFLYWMQQKGWVVQGIEFSRLSPNSFNLPIEYGRVEALSLPPHSFDVITMWAVLEHVHDPIDTLTRTAKLLAPGGRVFVLVPNFRSIPAQFMRHDDVPRHLLMFTPRTLSRAAETSGLRVCRIVFSDDIFSGSTRGFLNFAVKRLLGESYDEILTQNRSAALWFQFENYLNGKPSRLMRAVDSIDRKLTPGLDRLARTLRCGFTMTAELEARS